MTLAPSLIAWRRAHVYWFHELPPNPGGRVSA